jgi:two-component system phosphate regulon response regulator OmpR
LAIDAIAIGNRLFSRMTGTLTINGRALTLNRRECALLHELATNLGRPVTRERLSRAIQRPGDPCSARAVDSMILRLRRLIEPDAENPRHLRTVRGSGYILLPDDVLY